MYEVATMEMPQRSLLCLKRNVSEPGLWALGKEFAGIVRDQGIDPKQLSLTPEDLGVRITYLARPPVTETSIPECDFAVPFA